MMMMMMMMIIIIITILIIIIIIAYQIYAHLDPEKLLRDEQKACRKGSGGTND